MDTGNCSPGVTSVHRIPMSNARALYPAYVEMGRWRAFLKAWPANLLGIVLYGRNADQPGGLGACPVVCLDLPQLHEPPFAEVWTSTLPVTYHQADGIHFAMNDEVLFGAVQLEERGDAPLDHIAYTAYRCLLAQVRALGYPHLLRAWNHFSRINLESDGLERYRRFCAARHQALAEGLLGFPRTLPAGTAVGTRSGPLAIHFLAATHPGAHLANPRQMNAYEYPRVYGPLSPSFARATLRPSLSGSHLFIAGTASVVGHASQHIGEPQEQTLEILNNLNALIRHTEDLHGVTHEQRFRSTLLKVYVRHPSHMSIVRAILKQQQPVHTQVLYLQGEICRSELLVEIEGILSHHGDDHTLGPVAPSVSDPQPAISQHEQPDSLTTA
jgi:chorismate lyase/3-hydroxybenzoate synthase